MYGTRQGAWDERSSQSPYKESGGLDSPDAPEVIEGDELW
jgi:hypothetical protein